MTVTKNGVTTSGPATLTMTVPRSWVDSHGGNTAISIIRQGDNGLTESLSTQFTGYDPTTGDAIFEATSPHGLSIFALVALTPLAVSGDNGGSGDNPGAAAALANAQQLGPVQSSGTVTTSVTGAGAITSGPVSAGISGMDGAAGSWSGTATSQPSAGASITTTFSATPPAQNTLAAFQSVYEVQGSTINDIAFTMTVSKTGVATSAPAKITMSVPRSWVESHGGINVINIARQGDDGITESLSTQFTGYDPTTGAAIFEATSPHGLSIFALVALKPVAAPAGNITLTIIPNPSVSAAAVNYTTSSTPMPTRTPLSILVPIGAMGLVVIITARLKNNR
jgi:hypothetical protein